MDLENLSLYVSSYEKTKTELLAFYKAKDWNNYKIRVHALKSSSRMIGAASLGNLAEEAEAAAREGDEQKISQLQEKILEMYEQVVLVARRATQLGEEKGEGKKEEEEEGQEGK